MLHLFHPGADISTLEGSGPRVYLGSPADIWVITWSGRLGLGSPDRVYFDLLGYPSTRSEGGITWSARGAGSPSFDSDRPAPSGSAPPTSLNSGEPMMVISWSPELPSVVG